MRLLICAEAGRQLGAGHVMRGLAVAEQARVDGWNVTLAADLSALDWVQPWIDALGVKVSGPVEETPEIVAAVAATSPDVVLLDGYRFPDSMRAVADQGAVLVNFEDGLFGRRPAHVVVDYQLGAELGDRPNDGSSRVLLGITYAPIRREVSAARGHWAASGSTPQSVAVLMGGTDAAGLTSSVAPAVEAAGARVVEIPKGLGMVAGLQQADAVISAAGVSAYELCCLGIPTALVQVVDNQAGNYAALVSAGAVTGLGDAERVGLESAQFGRNVSQWLRSGEAFGDTASTAADLVDGQGAARILREISSLA